GHGHRAPADAHPGHHGPSPPAPAAAGSADRAGAVGMSRLLRRPAPDRRPPPPAAAAAIEAVRRLDLSVGRTVDGLLYGNHAGRMPGLGSEAGESRRYAPGDDPRRIDWNVSARSQDPYVRDA